MNAGTAVRIAGPRILAAAAALLTGAAVVFASSAGAASIGWGVEGARAAWGERSLSVLAFFSPAQRGHALQVFIGSSGE